MFLLSSSLRTRIGTCDLRNAKAEESHMIWNLTANTILLATDLPTHHPPLHNSPPANSPRPPNPPSIPKQPQLPPLRPNSNHLRPVGAVPRHHPIHLLLPHRVNILPHHNKHQQHQQRCLIQYHTGTTKTSTTKSIPPPLRQINHLHRRGPVSPLPVPRNAPPVSRGLDRRRSLARGAATGFVAG